MNQANTQTSKTSLDFSPLTNPVTEADLAAYMTFIKASRVSRASIVVVTIFGAVASFFVIVSPIITELQLDGWGVLLSMAIWAGVIGASVYGLSRMTKAYNRKMARLYVFALRNNATFIKDRADPAYSGMIFDEGHSRSITLGYNFPGHSEIGNYIFTTGSGKNSQTHNWGYIKTKLPRRLPNMVLDAKGNNTFGKFTNLPDAFSKNQVLSLEGDFNDHFTLYAPKEYERDALYVFTPDVMGKLIDNGGGFDMEVVDDELFIYKSGQFDLSNAAELTKLLSIVDSIGSELREQTDYYADERVGDRTQNIVAPQGLRLRRSANWAVVIGVIAYILYMIFPTIVGFIAGSR